MFDKVDSNSKVYLNKHFVGKPHSEYIFKVDYTVIFTNEEKNIKKQIVDKDGNILDFPGFEYDDKLNEELGRRTIEPIVKYEAIFEKIDDNKFLMIWTIRPDGRYWMDSFGFGAEDYESLSLYTYIDSNGNFTMPFKLYSIGYQFYGDCRLSGDKI
ncbi:MAG: hypothetical protein E7269_06515 [Lachnospiraceae bacterium]|nr:hypothetical protein [Lachnospiraceae bacterium]